jgi:hypothetical protein
MKKPTQLQAALEQVEVLKHRNENLLVVTVAQKADLEARFRDLQDLLKQVETLKHKNLILTDRVADLEQALVVHNDGVPMVPACNACGHVDDEARGEAEERRSVLARALYRQLGRLLP